MTQYMEIHPDNPQLRLIRQVAEQLNKGAVVVYPTDTAYALGCLAGDKKALERIIRYRDLSDKHLFTLLCADLSQASQYARIENRDFRLMKSCLPGPYTFILEATRTVSRHLQSNKRHTIGIRIPDHPICQALTEHLSEPLLTTTCLLPGQHYPLTDPYEIYEQVKNKVEVFIDGGPGQIELTTIVDLTGPFPIIKRQGLGPVDRF